MDDNRPEAEARMRESLGLSGGPKLPVVDDPQRLARQAIRSQAAARDYAERQLLRAEQTIQDLHTKFHAVRREKDVAVEAVRAAQAAQAHAGRNLRAVEAALSHEKAISGRVQRDVLEARTTIHDLRTKLALANQTVESLQTQLAQERQAQIAAEHQRPVTPVPAAVGNAPEGQPVKRGRPPGKRDASAPRQLAPKARKAYSNQEPVQWWTNGWAPSA